MAVVTLNLPDDTARRLDEFATAERRSRSNAASVLLDRLLAPEVDRPVELERATPFQQPGDAGRGI